MSQAATRGPLMPTIPLPGGAEGKIERSSLVGMVLKAPRGFAQMVAQDQMGWQSILVILAAAAGFDASYGVVVGVFSGGHALWLAALKVPLAALASLALSAPSLYVLLGLGGSPISLRQTAALLAGAACLASMLLVGFAPVAWLFGVSTTNVQFMILLHLVVGMIGASCGLRLLGISVPDGCHKNRIMLLWMAVFVLVSAQMLTYFRPLLTVSSGGTFRDDRKVFFFEHFYESMTALPHAAAVHHDGPPPGSTMNEGYLVPPRRERTSH